MKGFIKEFREFAVKGNVVDLAVGVIIGTAFGKIVSSLVADVVMPPIGVLLGGMDFSDLAVVIQAATAETPEVLLNYGKFLQTVIDFLIIALTVFFAIKLINSLKRRAEEEFSKQQEAEAAVEEAPPAPSAEQVLLTEIRDLLKQQRS